MAPTVRSYRPLQFYYPRAQARTLPMNRLRAEIRLSPSEGGLVPGDWTGKRANTFHFILSRAKSRITDSVGFSAGALWAGRVGAFAPGCRPERPTLEA